MSQLFKSWVSTVALATGLAGCAAEEPSPPQTSALRAWAPSDAFWDIRAGDEGNGPVSVREGSGPVVLDWIIWDVDAGESVYEGPLQDGLLIATIVDNRIHGPDGAIECTAYEEEGLYKLRRGVDGEVLYTASLGRHVFEGDIHDMPEPGSASWAKLLSKQLALEFQGDQLFAGTAWSSSVLGTANVRLDRANPMRKLVLAAMYGGECGSNGPRPLPLPAPLPG